MRIRCRDFTFFAFHFDDDMQAREIFDTIRSSTCKINHVDQLLAFTYTSNAEKAYNGWNLYDPRKEFARMGISEKSKDKGWRISNINMRYQVGSGGIKSTKSYWLSQYSPTYPSLLCVPSIVSDTTLKHTASFRSKTRIPVLTYLHPLNDCTITRSAQPSAGIRGTRSPQDEKLVNAIFRTTRPSFKIPPTALSSSQQTQSSSDLSTMVHETAAAVDSIEINVEKVSGPEETLVAHSSDEDVISNVVYGAQQTNMIVDARPSVNAMANQALGYGSENMEGYPTAKKLFLGIDNIHVMRKAIEQVVEALKDSDLTTLPPLHDKLEKSNWKKHISMILSGSLIISNTIAIQHSHVLIHCSDGWDRTSQLSALAQICLDPYYRTMEGFMVLIEKDWMSFGHMFRLRSGLLQHEKWFEMENERVVTTRSSALNNVNEAADGTVNAFETAIAKAQGFFRRKVETTDDLDGDLAAAEGSPSKSGQPKKDETMVTKPKEMSPIFQQFLDATYQLLCQYPTRFEFNERFLRRLFYHLYSCQYGNFLYNSEKERTDAKVKQNTESVWGYFLSKKSQFLNDKYDPAIDENNKEKASLIEPRPHEVRWWNELFGRTEAEMNGPFPTSSNTSTFETQEFAALAANDNSSSAGLTVADGEKTEASDLGSTKCRVIHDEKSNDQAISVATSEDVSSDVGLVDARVLPEIVSEERLESSDPLGVTPANNNWTTNIAGRRKDALGNRLQRVWSVSALAHGLDMSCIQAAELSILIIVPVNTNLLKSWFHSRAIP